MPATLCFEVVVTNDELTGHSVFEPVHNIFNAQGTPHLIEIVDIKKIKNALMLNMQRKAGG